MRRTCLDEVFELARKDERVFFVGSDLGAGTLNKFKAEMPDRFFMEGICEGNIIGMAAGLALDGKIVYVNTIATFLTRRAYEQVVLDLCLHQAQVRLIGNGGGMVYAPLGPTHMAIEDMAIMRALPHMTVAAPADAHEMKQLMPLTLDHPGPMYIRVAKGFDPIVTEGGPEFEIGRAKTMRHGDDALIVTTGVGLQVALNAADDLTEFGLEAAVLHCPTVKPLDVESLVRLAERPPVIVSLEEHTVIGGLGSAVAEVLAESDFDSVKRFRRLGLPDTFPDQYGSQAGLMDRYGLNREGVRDTVLELAGLRLSAAGARAV